MSEYKTLKELLGDATESKNVKFINEHGQLFEPRFLLDDKWYGVTPCASVVSWTEFICMWKEWHPTKKKVTKYFWVDNKTGKIFDSMYATTDCNFHGKLTRLDWSATEFDDEN